MTQLTHNDSDARGARETTRFVPLRSYVRLASCFGARTWSQSSCSRTTRIVPSADGPTASWPARPFRLLLLTADISGPSHCVLFDAGAAYPIS
jgi:hypothetical protein